MSPDNVFIFWVKRSRSNVKVTRHKKQCRRGLLHSCECWLLVVLHCAHLVSTWITVFPPGCSRMETYKNISRRMPVKHASSTSLKWLAQSAYNDCRGRLSHDFVLVKFSRRFSQLTAPLTSLSNFCRRDFESHDDASEVGGPEMTSLAEELGMVGDKSLLPAHDSCEVDSMPEDGGNRGPIYTVSYHYSRVAFKHDPLAFWSFVNSKALSPIRNK